MARIAQIDLRARPSLKAKLEKLAKHDRRTLSAYVEKLLEDHVTEQERRQAKQTFKEPTPMRKLVCMTRLILKAIDVGASAVFMALCTKAFCVYLFKQPSARPVQSKSDRPRPFSKLVTRLGR